MSTLSSSSTWSDVLNEYKDNASYIEDASVAKAKAFVTACSFVLLLRPSQSQQQSSLIAHDNRVIQKQMEAAQQYVVDNETTAGAVRHSDFREFRV